MSDADSPHGIFLRLLREKGFSSVPWTERRTRVRFISEGIRSSSETCRDETILALLLLLAEDDKAEVRQEVARLIPRLPYEVGLQIECRLDEDEEAYVLAAVRTARKERLKNERDAAVLYKGVEILASRTASIRVLNDTERTSLLDRLFDLLQRGAQTPDPGPCGASLRDAAMIHEDCDPERVEATLKRWNKSRVTKPAPIGKDSRHSQTDLFSPDDLAEYVACHEGRLTMDRAVFIQRLKGIARPVRPVQEE